MMYCAVGDSGTLCSCFVLRAYFHPQIASGTFCNLAFRVFRGDAFACMRLHAGNKNRKVSS
jgi:hypothetical protein